MIKIFLKDIKDAVLKLIVGIKKVIKGGFDKVKAVVIKFIDKL